LELRKVSNDILNDYKKVIKDEYDETNWKRDHNKINTNIKNFESNKSYLKNKISEIKSTNREDENLLQIEKYVETVENDIVPLILKINDKTKYYNVEAEEDNKEDENQPQGNMLIQDLANNKEVLEERRKQLESIHQASAKIKDISDTMAKQLDEQGAILDEVENNVNTAEDNAKKAKEEIKKADETSRGNRKKMICYLAIIAVFLLATLAIVLSLIT
jgi:chromosome segregation ATPase